MAWTSYIEDIEKRAEDYRLASMVLEDRWRNPSRIAPSQQVRAQRKMPTPTVQRRLHARVLNAAAVALAKKRKAMLDRLFWLREIKTVTPLRRR
jgi:hypothetical protein